MSAKNGITVGLLLFVLIIYGLDYCLVAREVAIPISQDVEKLAASEGIRTFEVTGTISAGSGTIERAKDPKSFVTIAKEKNAKYIYYSVEGSCVGRSEYCTQQIKKTYTALNTDDKPFLSFEEIYYSPISGVKISSLNSSLVIFRR